MIKLPSFRILLVEDNPINQQVAMGILLKWGHVIDVAENGLEALQKWETGNYDLILMDVQMPQMSGLEATVKIREREQDTGGHIPIIGLTAQVLAGDKELCFQAGMDDYVPKPIKKERLSDALSRVGDLSPKKETEKGNAAHDTLCVLDIDTLALLKELEAPGVFSLGELIGTYIETTPNYFNWIECAIKKGDAKAISSNAHALKGSCQSVGAVQLAKVCEQLELLGKEEKMEDVWDCLGDMRNAFEMAKEALLAFVHQGKTD
jgi:CheY-like chemotaxis protein/HPt (histidine-containing phosphotransfer) domain-containing protein